MIKAVIFDMYETLITLYGCPTYFGAQIAADADIPTETFYQIWRSEEFETGRTIGKVTLEQTIETILKENGRYSEDLFHHIINKRIQVGGEAFSHLHPEILPMLSALRQNGIKIGLISNCYLEEAMLIQNSVLYPYFDVPCLSCHEGIKKPDPTIFYRCTERLGVSAEECLYVGDGGSAELETAAQVGMHPIQAVWYLKENTNQPCARKPEFMQAELPLALLSHIQ